MIGLIINNSLWDLQNYKLNRGITILNKLLKDNIL